MASPVPSQSAPGQPTAIPLRFQRQELQLHAGLSAAGLAALPAVAGPQDLVVALTQTGAHGDAIAALAMMLPRRQSVWWSCLAVRLIPDLSARPAELFAVEAAEAWVHGQRPEDAERAQGAAEFCAPDAAATWAATAAFWCGPSLAPRGQQPVPPAAHLPGVAVRAAMTLTLIEPAVAGRLAAADLLTIGTALMHGDLGRGAQAEVAGRLAAAAN